MTFASQWRRLPHRGAIRPGTSEEFIALQAAQLLDAAPHSGLCLSLLQRHGTSEFVAAVRRCTAVPWPSGTLAQLVAELANPSSQNAAGAYDQLVLGIKVERRRIAVALCRNLALDRVQTRTLGSAHEAALRSAVRFVREAMEKFPDAYIAVEVAEVQFQTRRNAIAASLREALGNLAVVVEVSHHDLFRAFAAPSCRDQAQLRNAARRLWPHLGKNRAALDAAALALFASAQRLFETTRPL